MNSYLDRLSDEALEMVMRDVLDGLQELALERALISDTSACRVLSIGSRKTAATSRSGGGGQYAKVVDLQQYRARVSG